MTAMTEARRLVMSSDYPAVPAAVGVTRRIAKRRLEVWGVPLPVIENISLVISELVTNAVQAKGVRTLTLTLAEDVPGSITVEVRDSSQQEPIRKTPSLTDLGGRGLGIVEALACHCGVRPEPEGKTVFAVIETQ
ncbi:ATP-binding protein [Actinomadura fulvescens]|uniref:Histidine kinase/HSP90-like ATPase domain-containing protein n=1 Tax=Actinomadura fulvescens TaxID=46160 RepID=A0ABN3QKT1_9ACTN